jgi:hypothetical protein
MKTLKAVIALTVANAAMLVFSFAQPLRTAAQDVAPVLRGRALEIVDDHGRVRAEIKVLPAQPALKMPDGTTGYPETVQLRLINSQNGPHVKLTTTEDGSGLVLGGQTGTAGYTQLRSRCRSFYQDRRQGRPGTDDQTVNVSNLGSGVRLIARKRLTVLIEGCQNEATDKSSVSTHLSGNEQYAQ